ncbi:MAG: rhodanese-like domain-containing protein [Nitrospiraceae bacterium]|nr:MAG: rhodanese-like domain-containing protein [Nitrospiraceae bacterium]
MKLADLFRRVDSISPDEARQMLADRGDGVSLVDVREPREYEQGHIPGAILMPMSVFTDRMKELDPSKPVITY